MIHERKPRGCTCRSNKHVPFVPRLVQVVACQRVYVWVHGYLDRLLRLPSLYLWWVDIRVSSTSNYQNQKHSSTNSSHLHTLRFTHTYAITSPKSSPYFLSVTVSAFRLTIFTYSVQIYLTSIVNGSFVYDFVDPRASQRYIIQHIQLVS